MSRAAVALRDRGFVAGAAIATVMVVVAVSAPLLTALAGQDPTTYHDNLLDSARGGVPIGPYGGVSGDHWLGVEPGTGRDLFTRIVYGARVSLGVAVGATILQVLIGLLAGLAAGLGGRWADAVLGRLFYLAPSDPAVLTCGKGCTPERLVEVRHAMGVDDPAHVQYAHFLQGLVAGRDYSSGAQARHCPAPCLGYSFETDQSVTSLLADRLPVSASLAIGAEVLSLLAGVGAGLLSGPRRHRWLDRLVNGLVLTGYAVPVFLVGLLLLLLFCVVLQWLPFPAYVPFATDPLLWAQNLLLPWVALAIIQTAYARLTRAGIQETLAEDHIRTARAYGLPERRIIWRRALRGAMLPLVTLTAIDLASIMTSAVLTETMFGLPGIGQLLVGAVNQIDLPVVVGVTLLTGLLIVIANAVADLLYAAIDPRVQLR
ncbi:ABC transporter permease subunit [Actinoplanes sp. NPDC089786]|uniref:ABC transporter permease subunit n=1 Tax=Actinoplanes sp. NPDC089786 TaxID=3155185 RepID=UPI00343CB44D